MNNKANLRDLIAASDLVISNEIQINFSARVTLKFDKWPRKTIGNLFHASISYVCHIIAIHKFILEFSSRNAQIAAKSLIFRPMWPWNLTDDLEKQQGTSTMPLQALCVIRNHLWFQTGTRVQKCPNGYKICFDLWPWPLTTDLDILHEHHFCQWLYLLKISWQYDDRNILKKDVTDGRMDREDRTVHRAACPQLNKLEQLERLRSETPPAAPWLPIQIPSENKAKSKLQILKNCQKFEFEISASNFTRDTPFKVAW